MYPHLIMDIEDRIFNECVVEGAELAADDSNAGIVTTIVREILNMSGVLDPYEGMAQLDAWRFNARMIEEQMILIVCKVFGYKPEELDSLEYGEFLRRVALAEQILGKPIQIAEPEKESEPESEKGIDFAQENRELAQGPRSSGDDEFTDKKRKINDMRTEYLRQRGIGA